MVHMEMIGWDSNNLIVIKSAFVDEELHTLYRFSIQFCLTLTLTSSHIFLLTHDLHIVIYII